MSEDVAQDVYGLKKELEFLAASKIRYKEFIERVIAENAGQDAPKSSSSNNLDEVVKLNVKFVNTPSLEQMKTESDILQQRLVDVTNRRKEAQCRRYRIGIKLCEGRQLREKLGIKINELTKEYDELVKELKALEEDCLSSKTTLAKFMRMNVLNDAFYIWFNGPFATINSFRLGQSLQTPHSRQVDWIEINAALGQAVLAISHIAQCAGFRFKKYSLIPYGSFSKVCKNDDKKTTHNLHTDTTMFTLFPKSKFNPALLGFLFCIKELGDFIAKHDPPLTMPYHLEVEEGLPPKIGGRTGGDRELIDLSLGTEEVQWTKALKYLLSNIKWMIAWSTKHTIRLERLSAARASTDAVPTPPTEDSARQSKSPTPPAAPM